MLVCFKPKYHGRDEIAERFINTIKELSADKVVPVEAFLVQDPAAGEVEQIMLNRVANFRIPKNAPLIIETFM